jgi:hypothetical protein
MGILNKDKTPGPTDPPVLVRVEALQSMAGTQWSCDKGDEVEVPLPTARRLIARGVARELKYCPLPTATADELAAAKVTHVRTIGAKPGSRLKHGKAKKNRCQYEPIPAAEVAAQTKGPGDD